MDKKKEIKIKEYSTNYLLTLGFILSIVIFIVLIISISRLVLNDKSSIAEHVKNTQNLLDDINSVENNNQTIEKCNLKNEFNLNQKNNINLNINQNNLVYDFSYYNINKNKSIISFKTKSNINKINNYYYLTIKNISNLNKRSQILYYNDNNEIMRNTFLSYEPKEKQIIIYDQADENIIKINNISKIIGELIYIKNAEN